MVPTGLSSPARRTTHVSPHAATMAAATKTVVEVECSCFLIIGGNVARRTVGRNGRSGTVSFVNPQPPQSEDHDQAHRRSHQASGFVEVAQRMRTPPGQHWLRRPISADSMPAWASRYDA